MDRRGQEQVREFHYPLSKHLWVSNLGGLLLVVIGLELMIVQSEFFMALGCIVAGVIVAMFPSNYEIVGMEGIEVDSGNDNQE